MGYRVMELGAAGDGKTNDAHVIQKAIDLCSEQGGGVVIMEGGHTYLSGSIVLKSHVELVVETGAVLKASEDLNDYQYISELAKRGHDHMVEVPTFVNCEYDGKLEDAKSRGLACELPDDGGRVAGLPAHQRKKPAADGPGHASFNAHRGFGHSLDQNDHDPLLRRS